MDDPALHPDLTPLAGLVGTWRGAGTGDYPTGAAFAYDEEITFSQLGTPVLSYVQRTRHPESGRPMHAEQGYWRPVPPDRLEAVIAHAVGIVEVQEGTVDGGRIELRSSAVTRTATAKEVDVIERSFRLDGDTLTYTVRMAAVGQPLGPHLVAELHRVEPPPAPR